MANLERLSIIIDELNSYLKKIDERKIKSEKDLEDDLTFESSSMIIFTILNKTIDLAEEVVKLEDLGVPTKYRDLFEFLERKKIISSSMEKKMGELIFLRNNISHRYEKLTKKALFNVIKDISKTKLFIEDIKNYYKKK